MDSISNPSTELLKWHTCVRLSEEQVRVSMHTFTMSETIQNYFSEKYLELMSNQCSE